MKTFMSQLPARLVVCGVAGLAMGIAITTSGFEPVVQTASKKDVFAVQMNMLAIQMSGPQLGIVIIILSVTAIVAAFVISKKYKFSI